MIRPLIRTTLAAALAAGLAATVPAAAHAQEPPYGGTIFNDPDIITSADRTTLKTVKYTGRGKRTVFDRRKNRFVQINAFLFTATYSDRLKVEAQVNPEFRSRAKAQTEARKYATEVGRLPRVLRTPVKMLWIHKGKQDFGGGTAGILIHTGKSAVYERDGILEETLVHEAAHTALDSRHATAKGWRAAQKADPTFISSYALDNPQREDVAESFLPWFALRHKRDKIDDEYAATVEQAIPNRLAYFDRQKFKL